MIQKLMVYVCINELVLLVVLEDVAILVHKVHHGRVEAIRSKELQHEVKDPVCLEKDVGADEGQRN